MPFCPRCRCEYNVGVPECIDCHVPLVLYRPTSRPFFNLDVDLEEVLIPIGALVCLVIAAGLFGIRAMAVSGQIGEPLGPMIASQPGCMVAFYLIVAILSAVVLVVSILRWTIFRR